MKRLNINTIAIHTCCADCFLNSINYLKKRKHIDDDTQIVSLFYNPNIHPRSEYLERLKAIKNNLPNSTKLVIPDYRPKEYFNALKETYKKGKRCPLCWELRIDFLFNYAVRENIEVVTTTLLSSNFQNRREILAIGKKYENKYNIKFIEITPEENIKNRGFYKQNYCGCCFSLVERMTKR